MTRRQPGGTFCGVDLEPGWKVYAGGVLTIGKVAHAAGLEAKTLRYYDRVGLLPAAARAPSGYRLYDHGAVARLRFIRRAKALGMSLADIRRILAVRDEGVAPCTHILELVTGNLTTVESQIAQLEDLRRDLRLLLRTLRRRIPAAAPAAEECPCFEIIAAFKKSKRRGDGVGGD